MSRIYFLLLISVGVGLGSLSTSTKGRLSTAALHPDSAHPGVRAFSAGTSFLFTIINSHINNNDTSYTETITLIVTNYDTEKTAEVLVSSPFETFDNGKFYVAPLDSHEFALPADIQTDYRGLHNNYYRYTNKSISVTSTGAKVSVVVRNAHSDGLSEDDYVIYPTCSLGTSYRTVGDETFWNGQNSTNIWSIAATQDNTTVTIYPSITKDKLVLNAGEVLTLAADYFPMTNYRIDTNFPVAVTSGSVCGFGYFNPLICNHEAVMLFPVQDSGLDFPFSQFISEDRGEIMLFGMARNTKIYLDGVYFDYLDDHEYYILGLGDSTMITTDKGAYAVAVSSIRKDGQGSPFLAHIPSVNQYTNQTYIQVTTGLTGRVGAKHYIRLQTALDTIGKLTVDNWTISPLFYRRQGRSTYYYAEFPVSAGTHVIQSVDASVKYAATVYGFAHFTAYAYTPGIDIPTQGSC